MIIMKCSKCGVTLNPSGGCPICDAFVMPSMSGTKNDNPKPVIFSEISFDELRFEDLFTLDEKKPHKSDPELIIKSEPPPQHLKLDGYKKITEKDNKDLIIDDIYDLDKIEVTDLTATEIEDECFTIDEHIIIGKEWELDTPEVTAPESPPLSSAERLEAVKSAACRTTSNPSECSMPDQYAPIPDPVIKSTLVYDESDKLNFLRNDTSFKLPKK
jgi:hypothetical protein